MQAGPPNDAPFTMASRAVLARGNEQRGLAEIWFGTERALTSLHIENAVCTHFQITPLGVERTLRVGTNEVTERIVIAPVIPAAVVEWSEPVAVSWEGNASLSGSRLSIGTNTEELDPTVWVRAHAAAAQRRRMEDVALLVHGSRVGEQLEWAKFQAAALPSDSAEAGAANALIADLKTNVLGIEADAERGRLRIAPHFPDDWHTVLVENVRVDDALVAMHYEADNALLRFSFKQTAGAYPIRLIFEPAVTQRVKHAFVDGTLATLDVRSVGGRVVLPVQIMLDAERVVEFELDQ